MAKRHAAKVQQRQAKNQHVTSASEYRRGQREARRMFLEAPTPAAPAAPDLAYFARQARVSARLMDAPDVTELTRAFHRGFFIEAQATLDALDALVDAGQ